MLSPPKHKDDTVGIELTRNHGNPVTPPFNLMPRQSPILKPRPAVDPHIRKLCACDVHTHRKHLMNGLVVIIVVTLGKCLVQELVGVHQCHAPVPKLLNL